MHDETKAIHIPTRRTNGSIAPPIELSTTFEHGPAGEHLHGFEGADGAIAFGSGMAAGAAVLSRLAPGSRVLFHKDLYFDFRKLAERILPNWGLHCESVDLGDAAAREQAIAKGVDLVWFETPSNPSIDILDIEV